MKRSHALAILIVVAIVAVYFIDLVFMHTGRIENVDILNLPSPTAVK